MIESAKIIILGWGRAVYVSMDEVFAPIPIYVPQGYCKNEN
jgi:hypothetical protein